MPLNKEAKPNQTWWSSSGFWVIASVLMYPECILADFTNVEIWMVSNRPYISNFSSTFGNRSKCTNYNWYYRQPHVPQFFLFFGKDKLLVSLLFLCFLLYSLQNSQYGMFFFFFCYLSVDVVFYLGLDDPFYLKIPKKFIHIILWDGSWLINILVVRIVEFQFLAQFLVDHFSHRVVSSLIP